MISNIRHQVTARRRNIISLILLVSLLLLAACGRGSDTDVEVAVALTQTAVAIEQQADPQPESTDTPTVAEPTATAAAVPEEEPTASAPESNAETNADSSLPVPLFFIDVATKQVVRLETDGVTQTTLTDEATAILDFDISPDGSRLAYIVANQLVEFDFPTSTKAVKIEGDVIAPDSIQDRLERRIHAPHYSPDGSQIAFGLGGVHLIDSGPNNDIYPLLASSPYPTAGSQSATSDEDPIRFFWPLGWSPDGSKLLVEFAYYPEAGGLALYDLAVNEIIDFTSDDPNVAVCCEAAWSPDSARLYLASNLLVFGNPGLSVVNADTGAVSALIQGIPSDNNSDFNFFRAPLGAADGVLTFLNRTADLGQMLNYSLTGISEDGGEIMPRQSGNIELEGEAVWVADGSGVAYLSDLTIAGEEITGQLAWWPVGGEPVYPAATGHGLRFPAPEPASTAPIALVDEGLPVPTEPVEDERSAELSDFVVELWGIDPDQPSDAPGIDDVFSFPLRSPSSVLPLWASHTVGIRNFEADQYHTIGVFAPDGDSWQELARLELGEAADPVNAAPVPDYLAEGAVTQVNIEPTHQWLNVEGGAGAHSGTFNLLSYDEKDLRLEASGFSASPGVAGFSDLSGDGNQEVFLDASDYYVFCYACGVRLAQYDILRWNGTRMEGVSLQPLLAGAPPALAEINEQALTLVQGGLWKDALAAIDEGRALDIDDPTFEWNGILIELNANAKRQVAADDGGYPILDNIFYGDYEAAVDIMRDFGPNEIFTVESPLIEGAAADGSEELLADWITRTTASALDVMPDLAPAHYLRGWAAYLESEDTEMALPAVAQAAAIDHEDELYSNSVAYLLGDEVASPPTPIPSSSAAETTGPEPSATPVAGDTVRALTLVNVRSGPSTAALVLGELNENDVAQVTGRSSDEADFWWQIVYPPDSDERGWVSGDEALVEANAMDAPVIEVEESYATASPVASAGRLFFSAQNVDGNDVIFQLLNDGTALEVVEYAKQPAIQPGGDRLAFHSTRDDMLGLGGYDLGGDERLRFAFNIEDGLPTWNPDVQRIIFASTRYGDGRSRLYGVWGDSQGDAVDLGYGQDPDWHPSEDLIVFKGCDASGALCGLWTMQPDGSDRHRLTENANDSRPVWTPDGSAVVFMSNDRDGNWELYRLDVASGSVTRLTDNPANDGLPAVSPDGRQVAFMSNRDGVWTIQAMPATGGPSQTLYAIGDNVADWLSQGIEWEE